MRMVHDVVDALTSRPMTLGTGLALFGGFVLLLLLLHGWWSARRARPRRPLDAVTAPDRADPALDGRAAAGSEGLPGGVAGVKGGARDIARGSARDSADASAVGRSGGGAGGHTADDIDLQPGASPLSLPTPLRRSARLDALIDAIVPMSLDAPISGALALQHLPPTRRAGSKPFYIEGLDTETGDWEAPVAAHRYSELQAGVQMASRTGPLNEIEYSEFVQKAQTYADAVGASTDAPDMLEVVARARELDALTSPLDAQLAVTLRSHGVPWSVAFVQQAAGHLGLVPSAVPGRMVLPANEEAAPPVLALTVDPQAVLSDNPQGAVVRSCTLSLDVPQTPAAAEPFPTWHRLCQQLAEALDATAVDDHGRAITLHAFDAIGKDLDQLYDQLQALDLAAGSAAARRLFS